MFLLDHNRRNCHLVERNLVEPCEAELKFLRPCLVGYSSDTPSSELQRGDYKTDRRPQIPHDPALVLAGHVSAGGLGRCDRAFPVFEPAVFAEPPIEHGRAVAGREDVRDVRAAERIDEDRLAGRDRRPAEQFFVGGSTHTRQCGTEKPSDKRTSNRPRHSKDDTRCRKDSTMNS